MAKFYIKKTVDAEQWVDESVLPAGCHLCKPEIHYSVNRTHVYFSYADLSPKTWISTAELAHPPESNSLKNGMKCQRPDGTEYFREILPFAFWNVKSEASAANDHRAVFPDLTDQILLRVFEDFCFANKWPPALPVCAEYREISGEYGRGYLPVYFKKGDWLIRENVPSGHNNLGTKTLVRVETDEQFKASTDMSLFQKAMSRLHF